jgi:hypothetical protein
MIASALADVRPGRCGPFVERDFGQVSLGRIVPITGCGDAVADALIAPPQYLSERRRTSESSRAHPYSSTRGWADVGGFRVAMCAP